MTGYLIALSLFAATAAPGVPPRCSPDDCAAQQALRRMSAATVLETEGHVDLARALYEQTVKEPGNPYADLARKALDRLNQQRVNRDSLFGSMFTTAVLSAGLVETSLLKFGPDNMKPEAHVLVATGMAIGGAYGGLRLARHFQPSPGAVEAAGASAGAGFITTLALLAAHAEGDDMPAALLLATVVGTGAAAGGAYLGQRYHVHESSVRLAITLAGAFAIETAILLDVLGVDSEPIFTDTMLVSSALGGALGIYLGRGRALPTGRYLSLWVGGIAGALAAGSVLVLTEPDSDELAMSLIGTGIGVGMGLAWHRGRQDQGEPYPAKKKSVAIGLPVLLPDPKGGLAFNWPALHMRF